MEVEALGSPWGIRSGSLGWMYARICGLYRSVLLDTGLDLTGLLGDNLGLDVCCSFVVYCLTLD